MPQHLLDWSSTARFGLYIAWLNVFPLSGDWMRRPEHMAWFLLPHAVGVILLGLLGTAALFGNLYRMGVLAAAGVTAVYSLLPDGTELKMLLAVGGFISAPMTLGMALLLKRSSHVLQAVAAGLALGNLVLFLVVILPIALTLAMPGMAALLLAGLLLAPLESWPQTQPEPGQTAIVRYLPFVFLFELVGGLMYGTIYPSYRLAANLYGMELLLYAGSVVFTAIWLARHKAVLVLLMLAILLSVQAFAFIVTRGMGWHADLAMYCMMLATGIVDVFVLYTALESRNVVRSFAWLEGSVALGIVGGYFLNQGLDAGQWPVMLTALLLLNAATLALLIRRNTSNGQAQALPLPIAETVLEPESPVPAVPHTLLSNHPPAPPPIELPRQVAEKLSTQECKVLLAVQQHSTYREVAQTLAISESTVKTYMQRIYRKLQIYRRDQLDALCGFIPPNEAKANQQEAVDRKVDRRRLEVDTR